MKANTGVGVLAASVLLAACGSDDTPVAEVAEPVVAAPAASALPDPVSRMARGVSTAKAGAAVDLRYEVLARPAVGTPFDIEIALVATGPAETMTVSVGGMPGLTVTNDALPVAADLVTGDVNTYRFTALADQAGVYYASVTVTTVLGNLTQGRTFSIPLLVGDTQPSEKATLDPPTDARGQAIESMPAKESTR